MWGTPGPDSSRAALDASMQRVNHRRAPGFGQRASRVDRIGTVALCGDAPVRRLLPLLFAPLAALLLTGCIRAEITIRVSDDGSGTLSILSAVDGSALAALGGAAGGGFGPLPVASDLISAFSEVDESGLPPGATVRAYGDGNFVGVRVTAPFDAADDVAGALDQLTANGSDAGGLVGNDGLFESLVLERDGDGWLFEAQFLEDTAAAVTGGEGGADLLGSPIVDALISTASFTVRIALPGTILEHNADEIAGDELVWNVDMLDAGARPLTARTAVTTGSGRSSLTVLVAVLVVGLVTAGAIVGAVRRRSRG